MDGTFRSLTILKVVDLGLENSGDTEGLVHNEKFNSLAINTDEVVIILCYAFSYKQRSNYKVPAYYSFPVTYV